MANIAAIISAVLLALAALYAFKNKQAAADYQAEIVSLGDKKEKTTTDLKIAQNDVAEAKVEITEMEAAIAQSRSQLEASEQEIQMMSDSIDSKSGERDANRTKIADAQNDIDRFGDIDTLLAAVEEKQTALDEMESEIITAESRLAILESSVQSLQSRANELQELKNSSQNQQSKSSLRTSIRQAMNEQGFVIINGGDNIGVAANSTLGVMRGGEMIAKLLVTTVETGSAAASIIPDSLDDGVRLRSGDSVVASN